MIPIIIILPRITSMHRYNYILNRLIIAKTFLQCYFCKEGMSHVTKYQEGKCSYWVASPKKTPT